MVEENGNQALKKRIRAGKVTREDVTRRLAELAFGRPTTAYGWPWRTIPSWDGWI